MASVALNWEIFSVNSLQYTSQTSLCIFNSQMVNYFWIGGFSDKRKVVEFQDWQKISDSLNPGIETHMYFRWNSVWQLIWVWGIPIFKNLLGRIPKFAAEARKTAIFQNGRHQASGKTEMHITVDKNVVDRLYWCLFRGFRVCLIQWLCRKTFLT